MKQWTAIIFMTLVSCGYNNTTLPSDSAGGAGDPASNVSGVLDYATVNAQVFQPHCLRCHSDAGGNRGRVNLETYANVFSRLRQIQSEVNGGTMPKAGPLPANLKNILNNWIAAGAPEQVSSSSPNNGGSTPPAPNPNPNNPGNGDDCDDDDFTRAGRFVRIQKNIYFDSDDQTLFEVRRHGDDDCDKKPKQQKTGE